MLINADASGLEWRTIAHLSKDRIAIQEIIEGADAHSDNQERFKLPSRLVAKKFLFRNIYCPLSVIDKTSYAFSVDNEFKHVGNRKFWERAIEAFYSKYTGIRDYHTTLIQTATTTGRIVSETGRIYLYEPRQYRGEWIWPVSDIANHINQGVSADLMMLIRVSAFRRLKEFPEALFINSVHDSLCLDLNGDIRKAIEVSKIIVQSFRDVGINYKRIYGKELLVPMDAECKIGNNWLWMHGIKI